MAVGDTWKASVAVLLVAWGCALMASGSSLDKTSRDARNLLDGLKKYNGLRRSDYWKGAKARASVLVILGKGCTAEQLDPFVEQACSSHIASHRGEWIADGSLPVARELCERLPALNKREGDNWGFACDYKNAYSMVFRRALQHIQHLGWKGFKVVSFNSTEEWRLGNKADIIVAPLIEYLDDLQFRYPFSRFILIHTDDAATIRRDLEVDDHRIIGVLMHTSFIDKNENNQAMPFSRRHSAWMLPEEKSRNVTPKLRPSGPLSNHTLQNKVQTIIPQVQRWLHPLDCGGEKSFSILRQHAFGRDEGWAPSLQVRPTDIAFVGTIGSDSSIDKKHSTAKRQVYKESPRSKLGVVYHRSKAAEHIRALGEKHNLTVEVHLGRLLFADYVDILRRTKMFVSPFGLGEFSGKDYEAILSGAMLVKPLAHSLESYPNIYGPDTALETQADFSDLEAVVMPFLSDAGHLATVGQSMVEKAQKMLIEQQDISVFAKDFDTVLEDLIFEHPVIGDL
mmetsp:Transcript_9258/g.26482  ORF Transcript_9258/g.26482 Transcript_9258/m.26482 type:complete len:509 (-) Transcript_9258:1949-3475(-)|eukprot:CAMPEP_0117666536 /NCGR_PEP_ID=MMETSP0804-20121206/10431_1 /TAXON_ID=1074897 /ORGANISM="Tetraselmis astigmatica, Strain CCMP880" /LENGTH=508 /DNA_ID=CAMNT_0005474093 /DNA_START=130 /DNA_END=1656 /DNA_ORIENTATION=-